MKKYLIFFLIIGSLLLDYNLLLAQKVQISEPVDVANEVDYELIGRYEDHFLLYRKSETKFYIQSFATSDLKQNWVKTIEFSKRDITPFKIVPHKESFSILYYFHKRGKTYIGGKEFNNEAQEIGDFNIGYLNSPLILHRNQIVHSQNKQFFLLYVPGYNGNVEVINFDIFDKKMVWQKNFKFLELSKQREFEQVLVNNMGESFIIFNENNTKRQRQNHQFAILKVTPNRSESSYTVPFNNYISHDMNIQYDEINQQLVASGLYTDHKNSINGIFYFNTDLAQIPTIQTSELEETFMRSLTGKKSKKINGIQNFTICQLVLRKDGGALLVAEQRFAYESSIAFYEEERRKAHADYLYENILVASIHPSGKVYWKDVLFKSQSSENDNARYSSFFAVKTNSSIRFVYNNDISWDTSIFEYVINSSGNVQRNVIAHQIRKSGVLPQLTSSIQVSASEVIALSERDRKLRLLKINY
ncbi:MULTISPECIES: hypothetical protein [unclassified Aureispira]|uniref:hypothetical protein n=1 Tax=unclassified Aureispira TaxID=2649989 RepID=UPI000698411A|nr:MULTISPECIES: hypothetical protein [unclassified Aureispira]WMX15537.1 hypothetical protein QP953_03990 [Aureispira sp. CCB-E]